MRRRIIWFLQFDLFFAQIIDFFKEHMEIGWSKHVNVWSAANIRVKDPVIVFIESNVGRCNITIHGEQVRGPFWVPSIATRVSLLVVFAFRNNGAKAPHWNLVVSVVILKLLAD